MWVIISIFVLVMLEMFPDPPEKRILPNTTKQDCPEIFKCMVHLE
jgi:hypothetical protein